MPHFACEPCDVNRPSRVHSDKRSDAERLGASLERHSGKTLFVAVDVRRMPRVPAVDVPAHALIDRAQAMDLDRRTG